MSCTLLATHTSLNHACWCLLVCLFLSLSVSGFETRTVREVGSTDQDKTVPDTKVIESLLTVLHALHDFETQSAYDRHQSGVMYNTLGYEIKRLESSIPGAGKGVFVTKGDIPVGSLVALYPGKYLYYFWKLLGSPKPSKYSAINVFLPRC